MITMDGTVMEMRGKLVLVPAADASRPAVTAPTNAAVAHMRIGELNIIENPNTPTKLATKRKMSSMPTPKPWSANSSGCSSTIIATSQATSVATTITATA